MTPEQFAYWLQGFAENRAEPPQAEQWENIKNHLATVFTKVTPPLATPGHIPSTHHFPGTVPGGPSISSMGGESYC